MKSINKRASDIFSSENSTLLIFDTPSPIVKYIKQSAIVLGLAASVACTTTGNQYVEPHESAPYKGSEMAVGLVGSVANVGVVIVDKGINLGFYLTGAVTGMTELLGKHTLRLGGADFSQDPEATPVTPKKDELLNDNMIKALSEGKNDSDPADNFLYSYGSKLMASAAKGHGHASDKFDSDLSHMKSQRETRAALPDLNKAEEINLRIESEEESNGPS